LEGLEVVKDNEQIHQSEVLEGLDVEKDKEAQQDELEEKEELIVSPRESLDAGVVGCNDYKAIVQYRKEFDIEKWEKIKRVCKIRGIENPGFTCHLISALQVLTMQDLNECVSVLTNCSSFS
jgi:hypothetical protein